MKKMFLLLAIAALAFASCSKDEDEPIFESVSINGIVWATRNVNAPGTFAATPESAGMFYKWGSGTGWSATNPMTSSPVDKKWGDVAPENGDNWPAANDPCPAGWRVPTKEEQGTLFDDTKVTRVWTQKSGIKGYIFTDIASNKSIFLPAAGARNYQSTLIIVGVLGYYWSSSYDSSSYAWALSFSNNHAGQKSSINHKGGSSVRCVAE